MAEDKKTSNFDLLPEARKKELLAIVERRLAEARKAGNKIAIENPDLIRRNLRENFALSELLKRNDGVVRELDGTRYARIGGIDVDETKGSEHGDLLNGVRITERGSIEFEIRNSVAGFDDGRVQSGYNKGDGYHCDVAKAIRGAVADALKDGKLDMKEAKRLKEFITKTPNVTKANKPCPRTIDL